MNSHNFLGYDRSYPSPEEQLIWRIEDLHNVIEELEQRNLPHGGGYHFSDDDIRYAIPEEFLRNSSLRSVYFAERAIELAIDELANKYGLQYPSEVISFEGDPIEGNCHGQMTFGEILPYKRPEAA